MLTITHKQNGYGLSKKTQKMIEIWQNYILDNLRGKIEHIELFNYGDKLVFATVKLKNNNFARYNITEKEVHFDSHYCSLDEYEIFSNATYNDNCHNNKLKEDNKE